MAKDNERRLTFAQYLRVQNNAVPLNDPTTTIIETFLLKNIHSLYKLVILISLGKVIVFMFS